MLKEAGGEEVLGSACNCVFVKVKLVFSVYTVQLHCTHIHIIGNLLSVYMYCSLIQGGGEGGES
jgi:hypothetical protein